MQSFLLIRNLNNKFMTDKQMNSFCETIEILRDVDDFTQFSVLTSKNRPINDLHVKALMNSFKLYGTCSTTIIVIETSAFNDTKCRYIADGQHRIVAANKLGMCFDVKVVKLPVDTALNVMKFIAALNNTSKSWSSKNYLNVFAKNDIYEYNKFEMLMVKHNLKVTDMLSIYCGNSDIAGTIRSFKDSNVKFFNEEDSDKLLNAVVKVRDYIPNKSTCRRALYKVMRVAKDYDSFADVIITAANGLALGGGKFPENETEFNDRLMQLYKRDKKQKSAKLEQKPVMAY